MFLSSLLTPCFIASALSNSLATASVFNEDSYYPKDVIHRDVVVVGGGSSGVYTAVRLRDHNKTVVVIERKNRLGGHAETYVDPATGTTIDIGVIVFHQFQVVKDYFSRFDIPLIVSGGGTGTTQEYVDFSTGKTVKDYEPPSQDQFALALKKYSEQLLRYPSIQDGFNLTYPVPPDLLLRFGDFVKKYGLGDLFPTVFLLCQGDSPILDLSTLYVMKCLNVGMLDSLAHGFLTTKQHNINQLYMKAGAYLGSDVLLNTQIEHMDRPNKPGPVKVAVSTPSGRKLIVAKKLVSAVPPKIENLNGYDLSDREEFLFSQFFDNGYYTGLLKNTGLPLNLSLFAATPGQPYDLPPAPGIYFLLPDTNAPTLTHVYYSLKTAKTSASVKAAIVDAVKRLQEVGGYTKTEPEFAVFSNHSPFNLMVSAKAIRSKFYEKLFALQGTRNTFYNGAAWQTQDSSAIWQFTENYLLPLLLAAL